MICQYFTASVSLLCRASYRNTPIPHFSTKCIFHCSMSSFHMDFRRLPPSHFDTRTLHPNARL